MIRCFGTNYRLHPLFVVMMALSIWTGYLLELVTLFGIVIIHELGHAAAARSYGWKVTEIGLLPFGGVMTVEEPDTVTAKQEIVVALFGPLQNGVMIALAMLMKSIGAWEAAWADYFIEANMWIGLFNLMPVPPLDGGRIVQALLGRYNAYYRTLAMSAFLGMTVSAALLPLSFYRYSEHGVNLNLLAVAVFLFFSNGYAYKNSYYRFIRFLIAREKQADRMVEQGGYAAPIVVSTESPAPDVMKMLIRERFHLIYVMDEQGSVRSVAPEQQWVRRFFSEKRLPEQALADGAQRRSRPS